jgi:hypothetical protein
MPPTVGDEEGALNNSLTLALTRAAGMVKSGSIADSDKPHLAVLAATANDTVDDADATLEKAQDAIDGLNGYLDSRAPKK